MKVCNPQPCRVVEECPNSYDTPVIGTDECGCDVLIRCGNEVDISNIVYCNALTVSFDSCQNVTNA